MPPLTERSATRARAGFTLVELLMAMILFLVTSSIMFASLRLMEKVQRSASEKAGAQLTLRSGSQTVAAELREVNNDAGGGSSDLLTISGSSVTYWAMRSSGMTCQLNGNEVRIRLGPTYSGYRSTVPIRDSLLLFADRDTVSAADDEWVQVAIVGSPTNSTCPDGAAALALTTPGITVADYQVPGPVRTFELMQLAIASNSGRLYLGARSLSGSNVMEPVIGPLTSGGLQLIYRDQAGSITTVPSEVRTIDLTMRSQSARPLTTLGGGVGTLLSDSLALRVLLRNAR
ncbi:MAG TPA: prepilin-type N-terminal cleavage/methylation domain-containing protein [Gemmatimonadales bacterium]|jgi:prepilin-type N-terminal cleavage/methylation domain-containing protein|nr:prepilin-type N-terminal cleavage/methylation domain-containing protein [Gemmatimonadales bacterium]